MADSSPSNSDRAGAGGGTLEAFVASQLGLVDISGKSLGELLGFDMTGCRLPQRGLCMLALYYLVKRRKYDLNVISNREKMFLNAVAQSVEKIYSRLGLEEDWYELWEII
jgi:hypothetical protein